MHLRQWKWSAERASHFLPSLPLPSPFSSPSVSSPPFSSPSFSSHPFSSPSFSPTFSSPRFSSPPFPFTPPLLLTHLRLSTRFIPICLTPTSLTLVRSPPFLTRLSSTLRFFPSRRPSPFPIHSSTHPPSLTRQHHPHCTCSPRFLPSARPHPSAWPFSPPPPSCFAPCSPFSHPSPCFHQSQAARARIPSTLSVPSLTTPPSLPLPRSRPSLLPPSPFLPHVARKPISVDTRKRGGRGARAAGMVAVAGAAVRKCWA
ncbi:unnamed protein product [Closterium sp. Naga37s-1]|nr:unnamed protein product [Closterium sp. Naga37s-1]